MADKIDVSKLKVEAWSIDRAKDSVNNNKIHTKDSVARLAKSMASLGQLQPILVDRNGVIIAGHGRRMAARELGWTHIKVIRLDVNEATARKARIADNRTSNDNYDTDALARELQELAGLGEDLAELSDALGLSHQQIAMLAPDLSGVFEIGADTISTNVVEDVKTLAEENESISQRVEAGSVPLKDAFGFTRVTPEQSREIKRFIAEICAETELEDPAAALVQWIGEVMP